MGYPAARAWLENVCHAGFGSHVSVLPPQPAVVGSALSVDASAALVAVSQRSCDGVANSAPPVDGAALRVGRADAQIGSHCFTSTLPRVSALCFCLKVLQMYVVKSSLESLSSPHAR